MKYATHFDSGLWWAEGEFQGTPFSASGSTEKEAAINADAKYQEMLHESAHYDDEAGEWYESSLPKPER